MFLRTFLVITLCGLAYGDVPKINVNWILDSQMKGIAALLSQAGKQQVPILDSVSFGDITVKGLSLGDLTTISRRDTAYEYIPDNDILEADASVGLDNMTVSVESLTMNNKSVPATFTVGLNKLSFHQRVVSFGTSCNMTYSNIIMTQADQVTIHSTDKEFDGKDVTEFVHQVVLTKLNAYLNSNEFLKTVNYYLDTCNGGGEHLKDLIFSDIQ